MTKSAFKIARWILETEFKTKPQRVMGLVEAAIEDVRTRFPSRVCVHLHPDDHEMVSKEREQLQRLMPRDVQFDLVSNVELTRCSVIVETEMGHYDFGIESQLRAIQEAIDEGGSSR